MTTTELVHSYFTLATASDRDAYFAQFTADARVEDEGREHVGIAAIRRWRTTVPPVRYDVVDVGSDGDATTARTRISGDFPGSPVELGFRFGFDDAGRIRWLTIRP